MTQNQIATLDDNRRMVRGMLDKSSGEIEKALAGLLDPAQFARVCLTTYQTGGDRMAKCDPRTFIAACIEAAQLQLSPMNVLGECYIIPRWNGQAGAMWAYFQLGYRGAMKLARRGGEVTDMQPELVYANDEFREMKGTSRGIEHVAWYCLGHDEPGELILAYCTAKLRSGEVSFRTITRAEIDAAAARSGDPRNQELSNVWRDHFESMALKTAVHRLSKFLPIPDTAKHAIIRDEYREAGVAEVDLSAMLKRLGPEPERIVTHENDEASKTPGELKKNDDRKRAEQIYGALWVASSDFFERAQVERDRNKDGGVKFKSFIEWAADQGEPYPEDNATRILFIERAKAVMIEWKDSDDEDKDAVCDSFVAYLEKDGGPS